MTSTYQLPEDTERLDGRAARSARTRLVIIDAMRSLHMDGDLRPTAARVADRAGVSLRTVWQHFEDREQLLIESGLRDFELAQQYVVPIDPAQPLAKRMRDLIGARVRLFEAFAPVWRAARVHEPFSPQLRRSRDRLIRVGREQLAAAFAPELEALGAADRRRILAGLVLATTWSTWESLRVEQEASVRQARQIVELMVTRLLDVS